MASDPMASDQPVLPPIGSTPSSEKLTPQVGTSVLPGHVFTDIKPQTGTTLLIIQSRPDANTPLQSGTSILGEQILSAQPASKVSILGENTLPQSAPPQAGTSILRDHVLPSLPPPIMPRLVDVPPRSSE